MPFKFEALYGVQQTFIFTLTEPDGVDFATGESHSTGDTQVDKDDAGFSNTSNGFTEVGNGFYSIVLTGTELSAARVAVSIIDQEVGSPPSTKQWLDEGLIIETVGNENAQHNRRDPNVILATTIASRTDNSNFVVTDKPNDNNTLLNSVAFIIDNTTPDTPPDRSFRNVTSYTGSSGAVVLESDTDFTTAAGDLVWFLPAAVVASAAEIADAVLDEVLSGHSSAGTLGKAITDIDATQPSAAAISRIIRSANGMALVTVGGGSTSSAIVASSIDPASSVNDQFNGRVLVFAQDTTTAALRGQAKTITDFDHSGQTFTTDGFTTTPSSGDLAIVV